MIRLVDSLIRAVKNWWISLVVGIMAIVMGILCFSAPGASLMGLTYVFILGFIVGGLLDIIFATSNSDRLYGWGWALAGGILELLLGLILLALPVASVTAILMYYIGFWILFRSIWSIGEAAQLNMLGIRGWGWALALSIISVIISFIYLMSPLYGKGMFVVGLVGIAVIFYGVFRIFLAIQLRKLGKLFKE
ncbi:MAG: HdeD family acid-resistance protein [Fermentimonas sp.]|jgi:uncharacterized membrane protein HdeD (DUF308 family)